MTKHLYVLDFVSGSRYHTEFDVDDASKEYYENVRDEFEDMDISEKAVEVMDYYGLHVEGCEFMVTDNPVEEKELA